ncbi:hypothetical protein IFO70_27660 [Phormidium tenue FACHB-886]|nr:hypothetical protein [Phormidium tenue FACHB-886]
MAKKGHKSRKGVGEFYDEVKVDTLLSLTPTARGSLDQQAQTMGISRSEVVERLARGLIAPLGAVLLSEEERLSLGKF